MSGDSGNSEKKLDRTKILVVDDEFFLMTSRDVASH